jgi:DNA-binding NarL/FixJ family response regulator
MEMTEDGKTSVLVVVDYPLLRQGVCSTLEAAHWVTICGETGEAAQARELCLARQPELAAVDLELEHGDGLTLLRELAALRPGIGLLALSGREEPAWVRRAFRAGARGVISKRDSTTDLPAALWKVYAGLRPFGHRIAESVAANVTGEPRPGLCVEALSDRELAVLRRVAAGEGPRQIALALKVAVTTVETHCARIKGKLGVRSADELKRFAARWAVSG